MQVMKPRDFSAAAVMLSCLAKIRRGIPLLGMADVKLATMMMNAFYAHWKFHAGRLEEDDDIARFFLQKHKKTLAISRQANNLAVRGRNPRKRSIHGQFW